MSKVKLNVTGMSCAACSAHVEKALGKTEGVQQATVSLMTNSASVTFDENIVSAAQLIEAVEKSGYGASVASNEAKAPKKDAVKQQAEMQKKEIAASETPADRFGCLYCFIVLCLHGTYVFLAAAGDFCWVTATSLPSP